MYAQVVVLTYQSPEIQSYTYEIPRELEGEIKVGQLVSVPFGKRTPIGVVLGVRPLIGVGPLDDKVKIKSIGSILLNQPILLTYQIELLKWMSAYYFAPMVNCLEAILPDIPKKLSDYQAHLRGVRAHPEGVGNGQNIVLVPSINRIPETLANYPQAKNYVIYHNELKMSERFAAWQKIISGHVDFVFGTRSAIFTPCPNLTKIIIYDEHDNAYKDERSPYYDTLTIAEKIQSVTNCQIQIIDSSPRITTYFNHKGNIHLTSHPEFISGSKKILNQVQNDKLLKVQMVSMLNEKAAGNKSPISDILKTYIKLGYQKNKRILLFLNKKTDSGHVFCKTCKFSDFAITQPEVCPNCQSSEIFFNSLNVQSLKNLVQKIIPEAEINILSENQLPTTNYPLPTFDIATATVFYKLSPQKYDLVAHIRTDSILNITDFTFAERLFWQITDLKKLTKGLLLLQTYNPEHFVIQSAANNNYNQFFTIHLKERRTLYYPPFSMLVKLSLKGKDDKRVEGKVQELYDSLNRSIVNSQLSNVNILGPYKPALPAGRSFFSKNNGKYNIIIKIRIVDYQLGTRENALRQIKPILDNVSKDALITVEPNNLN